MSHAVVNSDADLMDLLRVAGPLDVTEMADAIDVTPTAVRQRLTRMMARGLISREAIRKGRGRPKHKYHLTDRGLELTGSNFTDLARALWSEISTVGDPHVRREMLRRIARALASGYASEVEGSTPEDRLRSLGEVLTRRRVPCSVDESECGPVLVTHACPYPKLADRDRSVCEMEEMLFSEIVGREIRLSRCRHDGDGSCQFRQEEGRGGLEGRAP